MADGTIVIDTELKTDKLKNKLAKLNNDIERQTGKVKELQAEYDRLLSGEGAPAENPAFSKMGLKIAKAEAALKDYKNELFEIEASTENMLKNATPEQVPLTRQIGEEQVEKLNQKYSVQLATLKLLRQEADGIPQYLEKSTEESEELRLKLEKARIELERMQNAARGTAAQIEQQNNSSEDTEENLGKAKDALAKFEKRLVTMAKKVFVFSLILAALRQVKAYMAEALKTNEEFQASYANLKGTLMTAFQPILTAVIPIIKALINVLNVAANAVAKFTSWVFGTTVEASQKAAKALYDQSKATKAAGTAAEKAKKQMSGLDEMNTWQSDKSSGGGGTADVSSNPFDSVKTELGEMEVYVSGALLAIGAILAFTGVSIPLGIALMAIGAAGLASAIIPNWGSMSDEMQTAVTAVFAVLGIAGLVIGAILTFSGANIPLGIGLMIAGAGLLGTAAALNWDSIKDKIESSLDAIVAVVSGVLLVIGLILAISGVGIPIGIALILLGATGLTAAAAANWNAIKEKLQGSLGAIVAILSGFLLVIGLVLAFTGVGIPLGIGLILVGAAGLGTTVNANWDAIKTKIQAVFEKILAVASKAALVIGLILTVTGVAFPLGIALILAGAKGMAKYAPADWNALLKKIQSVWSSIKTWFNKNVAPKFTTKYWGSKFSSIKTALTGKIKGALNAAIALFNKFVNWVNAKMKISWGALKVPGIGEIIPKGSFQLLKLKNIPYLAQGGVIPANREFLAVLGDQKHGNNIEAPEALIRQIVREESGGNGTYTFVAQLDGRTIFREVIDQAKLSRKMTGKNAFVAL